MPDTITSFTEFAAGTKARAAQVNENFANYRGNLLPINALTASASHLTHNLGSTSHRFLTSYVGQVDFESSTATAAVAVKGDTSATAGALLIQIASTTVARVTPTGIPASSLQPGTVWNAQTFTGNGSFTCPSNFVYIFGCGGGGSGGGGGSTSAGSIIGGGGGSASVPYGFPRTVAVGNVLSITVGTGGAQRDGAATGSLGTAGNDGSNSSVVLSGTTIATWFGGPGGVVSGGGAGIATTGGSKSHVLGGSGGTGAASGNNGDYIPGSTAVSSGGVNSGSAGGGGGGGSGIWGAGGNGGAGGGFTGLTGTGYGSGGGGGGGRSGAQGGVGAPGANGIVIVYWPV